LRALNLELFTLPSKSDFLRDRQLYGPYRNNWQNYGSLGKSRFHCHLKKGHPIGKNRAKILAKALKVGYKAFL
jgi:hypothetical protein